jgi:neutral ceramidase
MLHGDNKGFASEILEKEKKFCPIAAFANANAGDVSGNVEYGTLPSAKTDRARKHGEQQAQAVMSVLNRPTRAPTV